MASAEWRPGKVYIAPAGSTSREDFKPIGEVMGQVSDYLQFPEPQTSLKPLARKYSFSASLERPSTLIRSLIWGPTCDAQTELLHRVQCHADGRNPGEPRNWRGERGFRPMPTTERTFTW